MISRTPSLPLLATTSPCVIGAPHIDLDRDKVCAVWASHDLGCLHQDGLDALMRLPDPVKISLGVRCHSFNHAHCRVLIWLLRLYSGACVVVVVVGFSLMMWVMTLELVWVLILMVMILIVGGRDAARTFASVGLTMMLMPATWCTVCGVRPHLNDWLTVLKLL